MNERDRVLDAFRNCITEPKCKNCPWTECSTLDNGNVEIPRDLALAVMRELVAQEPRVMTLEQVKLLKPDDDVWIEYHELTGWKVAAATVREIYDDGMLCRLQNLRYGFRRYGHFNGDYLAWRCWTQHPTDAQREATPWESVK